MTTSSRIPGFYQLSIGERHEALREPLERAMATLDRSQEPGSLAKARDILLSGGLTCEQANSIVENVIGVYGLPLGLALNFQVNGRDRLVPMVVEEPSVIAAASNAARMVRLGGGFQAKMPENLQTTQIELRRVPDLEQAKALLLRREAEILRLSGEAVPNLLRRGGGPRRIEVRTLGPGHLVLHVLVDTCDAMGANLVNLVAEQVGPVVSGWVQAELGLKILSNLCDGRIVEVRAAVPHSALVGKEGGLSGAEIAKSIEEASIFAERDPYRAATHNKGIMNGLDSALLATGNDYRAVEAGAHAYAASTGGYRPLSTWRSEGALLVGELKVPISVGIVGGTLRVHPTARMALALADIDSARDLAMLAACAGLASNLAALRALGTEGILRGHMALHARTLAVLAGAEATEVNAVAALVAQGGEVTAAAAEKALLEHRATLAATRQNG